MDYTHRHKDKTVDELDLFLKNDRLQITGRSAILDGPDLAGLRGRYAACSASRSNDLVNSGNYYDIVQLEDSNHFDKSWDIKEDILTLKAKANIDSGDLHGNVGMQVVRQKQKSSGLRINTGSLTDPARRCRRRRHVYRRPAEPEPLLRLDRHNRIRFAVAKVMARPRMDDMRANLVPGFNGGAVRERRQLAALRAGSWWFTPGRRVAAIPSSSHGAPRSWTSATNGMAARRAISPSTAGTCGWTTTSIRRLSPADFTGLTPPPAELAKLQRHVTDVSSVRSATLTRLPTDRAGGSAESRSAARSSSAGLAHVLDGFGATGSIS